MAWYEYLKECYNRIVNNDQPEFDIKQQIILTDLLSITKTAMEAVRIYEQQIGEMKQAQTVLPVLRQFNPPEPDIDLDAIYAAVEKRMLEKYPVLKKPVFVEKSSLLPGLPRDYVDRAIEKLKDNHEPYKDLTYVEQELIRIVSYGSALLCLRGDKWEPCPPEMPLEKCGSYYRIAASFEQP